MSDKQLIENKTLASFLRSYNLNSDELRGIASKTYVENLPAGRPLFLQDRTDNWTFFLLKGTVELKTRSGTTELITGGCDKANSPLAPYQPRRFTATSKTAISFIRIDRNLLELSAGHAQANGYEVAEITEDGEAVEDRLYFRVYQDYMNDNLVLPTMPEIALRVRKAIEDETHCNVLDIAKIIQSDPALTARIIQVANSPPYRADNPVVNCRDAITRLGLMVTRNLVISFTLKQLFQTKSRMLRNRMVELWQHSSHVAVLSYILAQRTAGVDADRALLAGLVHDIGVLLILNHSEQYSELIALPGALEAVIDKLRGQFGAMVLRKWNFANELVMVALQAEEWERDPNPRADYCDVVIVAQLHSFVGSNRIHACPPMDALPAFSKLALGKLTPTKSLQILDEAREDIQELKQLLFS